LPSVVVPTQVCVNLTNSQRVTVDTGGSLKRGTCSFLTPTKTVSDPTFATVDVICGLPQLAVCTGRADCAVSPVPDAPFTRLCIHKPGNESCPSADYAKRFVVYTSVNDARDCSACTGTTIDGGCGKNWGTGATCDTTNPPVAHTIRTCVDPSTEGYVVNLAAMGPKDIGCVATGGEPIGTVTNEDAVTICCNK
jgi:hypothetical protein